MLRQGIDFTVKSHRVYANGHSLIGNDIDLMRWLIKRGWGMAAAHNLTRALFPITYKDFISLKSSLIKMGYYLTITNYGAHQAKITGPWPGRVEDHTYFRGTIGMCRAFYLGMKSIKEKV